MFMRYLPFMHFVCFCLELTFLDNLWSEIKAVCHEEVDEDINQLSNYLDEQEFDSDAVLEDLKDTKASNIIKDTNITNKQVAATLIRFIQKHLSM